jgi:hypothetical protein
VAFEAQPFAWLTHFKGQVPVKSEQVVLKAKSSL